MNNEVSREPLTPEAIKTEIDDIFVFQPPFSAKHAEACQKIQTACRDLALVIAEEVPEGKEQTIAINNLLATALWARQGITRRQVVIGAVQQPDSPEQGPGDGSLVKSP